MVADNAPESGVIQHQARRERPVLLTVSRNTNNVDAPNGALQLLSSNSETHVSTQQVRESFFFGRDAVGWGRLKV